MIDLIKLVNVSEQTSEHQHVAVHMFCSKTGQYEDTGVTFQTTVAEGEVDKAKFAISEDRISPAIGWLTQNG
ncbi:MAG: hypothetical protein COB78_10915 [Hyphomicrobiales bacterium]|nr:MAG: hypothetical protein COB78_10915 [Hyphomicrobiales bacterium]